jgi:hypothetical protein
MTSISNRRASLFCRDDVHGRPTYAVLPCAWNGSESSTVLQSRPTSLRFSVANVRNVCKSRIPELHCCRRRVECGVRGCGCCTGHSFLTSVRLSETKCGMSLNDAVRCMDIQGRELEIVEKFCDAVGLHLRVAENLSVQLVQQLERQPCEENLVDDITGRKTCGMAQARTSLESKATADVREDCVWCRSLDPSNNFSRWLLQFITYVYHTLLKSTAIMSVLLALTD